MPSSLKEQPVRKRTALMIFTIYNSLYVPVAVMDIFIHSNVTLGPRVISNARPQMNAGLSYANDAPA